jgi:Fe-S cluster biosynthesis and repair protein YggX
MATITCTRCGQTREGMAFQPFQNDIGRRAFEQICGVCWAEWTKFQQQLINHYGLNLRDQQAKDFLYRNMEQFLFGKTEAAQGDRSSG